MSTSIANSSSGATRASLMLEFAIALERAEVVRQHLRQPRRIWRLTRLGGPLTYFTPAGVGMMDMTELDLAREYIRQLRDARSVSSMAMETLSAATILRPLLAVDGFSVKVQLTERGPQWMAHRESSRTTAAVNIALEYTHNISGQPVRRIPESILHAARKRECDRLLLISHSGFSASMYERARRSWPVAIELLTLSDVEMWTDRVLGLKMESGTALDTVQLIVRTMSHELALAVAKVPGLLRQVEWRDFERMIGRILEGIGFRTVITRSTKDGGKDVVVECEVSGHTETFIIELKHWTSGKRVGSGTVTQFVQVVAAEKRHGGVLLSTSGFANNAFASLTEIHREKVRFGTRDKIISLARTYERVAMGLWSAPAPLPDLLYEYTM